MGAQADLESEFKSTGNNLRYADYTVLLTSSLRDLRCWPPSQNNERCIWPGAQNQADQVIDDKPDTRLWQASGRN